MCVLFTSHTSYSRIHWLLFWWHKCPMHSPIRPIHYQGTRIQEQAYEKEKYRVIFQMPPPSSESHWGFVAKAISYLFWSLFGWGVNCLFWRDKYPMHSYWSYSLPPGSASLAFYPYLPTATHIPPFPMEAFFRKKLTSNSYPNLFPWLCVWFKTILNPSSDVKSGFIFKREDFQHKWLRVILPPIKRYGH